jgi:glutamyl-tRNA synthetase
MKKLGEWDEWTDFLFADAIVLTQEAFRRARLAPHDLVRVLEASLAELERHDTIDPARDEPLLRDLAGRLGVKVGDLFMTLRVAVTGKSATPPLLESMVLLGREKSLARLRAAAAFLRDEGESGDL